MTQGLESVVVGICECHATQDIGHYLVASRALLLLQNMRSRVSFISNMPIIIYHQIQMDLLLMTHQDPFSRTQWLQLSSA